MARSRWVPWSRPSDTPYGRITRRRWLQSRSPGRLVYHLFGDEGPVAWPDRRRCLLFEVACARRGLHLIEGEPVREYFDAVVAALEGADAKGPLWARADGMWEEFDRLDLPDSGLHPDAIYLVHEEELPAEAALGHTPRDHMCAFVLSIRNHYLCDFDAHYMLAALAVGGTRFADELAVQADLARDVFGDPFRPVVFDPAWRTDTVASLAREMHEANDFSAMPILADALEDAGCGDEGVLAHCRGPGPHARGCWVLEGLFGTGPGPTDRGNPRRKTVRG